MATSMPMPDNPEAIRAATLQGQIILVRWWPGC